MRRYLYTGVSVLHFDFVEMPSDALTHRLTLLDVIKNPGEPHSMYPTSRRSFTCSSHNGVIIEPGPPAQSEDNNEETSRNRGVTPKPKNKVAHLPPSIAPGSGALPGYYRQQGINAGNSMAWFPHNGYLTSSVEFVVFVPPRTQGVIVDPNFVGHPTSAARLAQPSWGPPPWADGTQPVPPYPIPGAPPPGYFAPYYHPGMPPLPLANAQFHPNGIGQPYAPSSSSPDGTCVPSEGEPEVPCSPQPPQEQEVGRLDKPGSHVPTESSAPVIDPSLDAPESHPNGKSPISLAITSAAMQAVLVETRRIARQHDESTANALESRESSPHTYVSESAPAEVMKCAGSNVPSVPSAAGHPSSTMLTEDGETMLHPGGSTSTSVGTTSYLYDRSCFQAELLTQVCTDSLGVTHSY